MELELEDNALSHDRNPVLARQRKFDKDEAVLARFGKRQQLRVSCYMIVSQSVWSAFL